MACCESATGGNSDLSPDLSRGVRGRNIDAIEDNLPGWLTWLLGGAGAGAAAAPTAASLAATGAARLSGRAVAAATVPCGGNGIADCNDSAAAACSDLSRDLLRGRNIDAIAVNLPLRAAGPAATSSQGVGSAITATLVGVLAAVTVVSSGFGEFMICAATSGGRSGEAATSKPGALIGKEPTSVHSEAGARSGEAPASEPGTRSGEAFGKCEDGAASCEIAVKNSMESGGGTSPCETTV